MYNEKFFHFDKFNISPELHQPSSGTNGDIYKDFPLNIQDVNTMRYAMNWYHISDVKSSGLQSAEIMILQLKSDSL